MSISNYTASIAIKDKARLTATLRLKGDFKSRQEAWDALMEIAPALYIPLPGSFVELMGKDNSHARSIWFLKPIWGSLLPDKRRTRAFPYRELEMIVSKIF